MSADNYYVVRKHPTGGYTYVMGFVSDEDPPREPAGSDPSFGTPLIAYRVASERYSEYGVSFHKELDDVLITSFG